MICLPIKTLTIIELVDYCLHGITDITFHIFRGEFGDFNDQRYHFHLKPLNTDVNTVSQLHVHILH